MYRDFCRARGLDDFVVRAESALLAYPTTRQWCVDVSTYFAQRERLMSRFHSLLQKPVDLPAEEEMTRLLAMLAVTAVLWGLATATAAAADPTNTLSETFTFSCAGGITFTATGITYAANTTGHVIESNSEAISSNGIIQAKRITVDGQLVRDVNGFSGRSLLECTLAAINGEPFTDAVVVWWLFVTPNRD